MSGTVADGLFRTEGGALLRFALPLTPVFAAQERRGEIVRVDEPVPAAASGRKPARTDSKGAWEEWAIANGSTVAEARAASKAVLIERFGAD